MGMNLALHSYAFHGIQENKLCVTKGYIQVQWLHYYPPL